MKKILSILLILSGFVSYGQIATKKDTATLPAIKLTYPATGVPGSATTTVAGYPVQKVDSAYFKYNTAAGADQGGWLTTSATGDSALFTAPFGVIFGNSIAEGHTGRHGRLHPLIGGVATATFVFNYPDSDGQFSYMLEQKTHYRWYNQGIGGQTSAQLVARFYRDVLGFNSNPNDGRGSQTILRRPFICIMDGGVNDIQTPLVVEQNLELMASLAQSYNVRLVLMNISGDSLFNAGADSTQLRGVQTVNEWLQAGALDQYGVCVWDYNYYWNNIASYGSTSANGRDNVHRNPVYTWADDIHPTMATYDSLTTHLIADCHIPVLTQMVVSNENSPTNGIANYARPTAWTINGVTYNTNIHGSAIRSTDTIPITSYIGGLSWQTSGDTVSIKITASTTVAGAGTQSGFSQINWFLDNNPNNNFTYTQRTFPKATNPNYYGTSATITARDLSATSMFKLVDYDASTLMNFVGGSQPFYTYGTGAQHTTFGHTFVGTVWFNNIFNSPADCIIGNLELARTASPTTTGWGVSIINSTSLGLYTSGGYGTNDRGFIMSHWAGTAQNVTGTSGSYNAGVSMDEGVANMTNGNIKWASLYIDPTINNTSAITGNIVYGIHYKPTVTSIGPGGGNNAKFFALKIESVGLNSLMGHTIINDSADNGENFRVNGSFAAAYIAKVADYTATANDFTIDVTTGADTITLPTAVGITGRIYNITNSSSGTVSVMTTSAQTFTNVSLTPTIIVMASKGSTKVQSTGANWVVLDINFWILLLIAPTVFMKRKQKILT